MCSPRSGERPVSTSSNPRTTIPARPISPFHRARDCHRLGGATRLVHSRLVSNAGDCGVLRRLGPRCAGPRITALGKKADALAALRRRLWVTNAPRPESTSLSGTESSSSRNPAGNSAWTIGSKTPSRPSARGRSAPRYRRDRKAAFAREESRAPRIGGPTRCLADEERGVRIRVRACLRTLQFAAARCNFTLPSLQPLSGRHSLLE